MYFENNVIVEELTLPAGNWRIPTMINLTIDHSYQSIFFRVFADSSNLNYICTPTIKYYEIIVSSNYLFIFLLIGKITKARTTQNEIRT